MAISMDKLLWYLGRPGRYQILVCLLLCFNYFQVAFNHLAMAFFGASPLGYRCGPTEVFTPNSSMYSGYEIVDTDSCLRYGRAKGDVTSWCGVRDNCTSCNVSTPFLMEDREWTIVAQFDLVCDRRYLVSLASSIYFLGVMVGGLFFGFFADTFGRLPVLIATLYLPTGVGIGLYFTDSYVLFVILRFIMGFLMQGLQIVMVNLLMEYFSPKIRGVAACIMEVFWGLGVFLLALIAFLLRDWRDMQLCISVATGVTIFYVWLFPESLRWLLTKGKYERAERLIRKISRYNGQKEVPTEAFSMLKEHKDISEKPKIYNLFHLLKNSTLRYRTFILWYIWFSVSLGYYGLILGTGSLPGFKYTTFLIGAGVELGAYLLAIVVLFFLGRRWPLAIYFVAGGVACIVSGVIEVKNTKTILALVGRFGMAGAFSVMFLYTSELYPTPMRSVGLGSCTFWTRVGGLLAPQINLLGTVTYAPLPIIIFGVLSIIAAFFGLLLPETLNKKLPDTFEDSVALGWGCCGAKPYDYAEEELEEDEIPNKKQEITKL